MPKTKRAFSDWKWAQQQTGQGYQGGDWFEVDESQIDKNNLDCVWRIKEITRSSKRITIHQIWSPVISMVLFIKLHLPLRTYQVRMLDSGEADTLRYENGNWIENPHNFALNRYSKGVFRSLKTMPQGLNQQACISVPTKPQTKTRMNLSVVMKSLAKRRRIVLA